MMSSFNVTCQNSNLISLMMRTFLQQQQNGYTNDDDVMDTNRWLTKVPYVNKIITKKSIWTFYDDTIMSVPQLEAVMSSSKAKYK